MYGAVMFFLFFWNGMLLFSNFIVTGKFANFFGCHAEVWSCRNGNA
jgi:hypothetical protein